MIIVGGLALWYFGPSGFVRSGRWELLRIWFTNTEKNETWQINVGEQCSSAPMIIPTTGYIGVGWGDSFRPGHTHSGYDIFSPADEENVTPVIAAYDGYLTREGGWRSAIIIRHPGFPAAPGLPAGVPGSQIWTYYTHMASADGSQSYISSEFPAGTYEMFVEAGTLLGYQGTWSGTAGAPTGLHLHFSVVKSTPGGGYANETDIQNTYDPRPFLGVAPGDDGVLTCSEE